MHPPVSRLLEQLPLRGNHYMLSARDSVLAIDRLSLPKKAISPPTYSSAEQLTTYSSDLYFARHLLESRWNNALVPQRSLVKRFVNTNSLSKERKQTY